MEDTRMRSLEDIRETAFIVARQYLAVEGARERPIGPVYQLHLDVLDLQIHAEADAERLAEKDAEIEALEKNWQTSYSRAVRNYTGELREQCDMILMLEAAIGNADCHTDVVPTVEMLQVEVDELKDALAGKHEHLPEYELAQIAGIAINLMRNIGIAPPPRRDLLAAMAKKDEEIVTVRADMLTLLRKSQDDIVALTTTLAEKDAEIAQLKSDLAQSRSAITKLSREIWKVC